MSRMGYGQQQGYGQPQQGYGQPQTSSSGYQKRQGAGGFVSGSTMGPAGSVDFASLARSAGGAQWSDPDFKPDDSSIWIDPAQPGGGAIGGILQMQVRCGPVRARAIRLPRAWERLWVARRRRSTRCGARRARLLTAPRRFPGLRRSAGSARRSCRGTPTCSWTPQRTSRATVAQRRTTSFRAPLATAISCRRSRSFAPRRGWVSWRSFLSARTTSTRVWWESASSRRACGGTSQSTPTFHATRPTILHTLALAGVFALVCVQYLPGESVVLEGGWSSAAPKLRH